MSSQLVFDKDAGEQLEAVDRTADAVRRRLILRSALSAAPSERILDVGRGPGFYCAELLEDIGPSGSVVAVDSRPACPASGRRLAWRLRHPPIVAQPGRSDDHVSSGVEIHTRSSYRCFIHR